MKTQLLVWIFTSIITATVMLQNRELFFKKVPMGLNLSIARFETAGLPIAVIAIGFFIVGYLVSRVTDFTEHHRLKTKVDTLKEVVVDQCATRQPKSAPATPPGKGRKDESDRNAPLALEAEKRRVQAS